MYYFDVKIQCHSRACTPSCFLSIFLNLGVLGDNHSFLDFQNLKKINIKINATSGYGPL